ncbi:MAG: TetR/AcrR family transcriptional regulator, partial [Proteobacteria bacterium]|nr:TetR/AcrR family transcriptional regulator [Pseudomonadota bacterium]
SQLGISIDTLYLYFPTKEAIILALFGRALEDWSEAMKARLAKPITDQQFLKAFYDTAMADPILVPLLIRLQHVIEHNVSIPLLIDSKRHFKACLGGIAERAGQALNLAEPQANELVWSLGVLLSGAAQSDQGPSLTEEDLPEDVAALMTQLSSQPLFLTNGRYILEGIRRDN